MLVRAAPNQRSHPPDLHARCGVAACSCGLVLRVCPHLCDRYLRPHQNNPPSSPFSFPAADSQTRVAGPACHPRLAASAGVKAQVRLRFIRRLQGGWVSPPTVSTGSLLCRHLPEPEGGSLAAPVAGGQSDAQVTQGRVNGARTPWEGRPSVLAVLVAVAQTPGAGGDCAFWPTSARPLETCCPRVTITCTPFRSLKHRCGQ